jgi:large subunit ribosomal protein L46
MAGFFSPGGGGGGAKGWGGEKGGEGGGGGGPRGVGGGPPIVRPPPPPSSFFLPNTAGLPFTPAPRETEADATGYVRTRDRKLKTSVFLAVRSDAEGNASGPRWTLPSAIASGGGGVTLHDAAKRAVDECAGTGMTLWCPGNAPMAANLRVYNPSLPEEFRGGYYGEKVLYYRVQHDSGDVDAESIVRAGGGVDDWGWLSKEEIVERVEGERGRHQAKFFRYML